MLLQTFLRKDFSIVPDDIWLSIHVEFTYGTIWTFHLVRCEQDSLAEEMGQNIVRTNKLKPPIKRVENIGFLIHKLVVRKRRLDVLEELRDSWIGLLMVLCRDEDACGSN